MAGRRSSALVLLACVTLAACGGGGGGGGGPGGGGGNGVLLASVTTGTFLGVDPLSGEGTRISAVGLTGFRSVQGVTFDEATGTLYGVDVSTHELITIDPVTRQGTAVGPIGFQGVASIACDSGTGTLYGVNVVAGAGANDVLITIDPASGQGTAVGSIGFTDVGALENNLKILDGLQRRAGCTILLALKGFAQWSTFSLVRKYLAGATASSTAEARLAREELGGEVHAYAPAYSDGEMAELVTLADHIVLNSPNQWRQHRAVIQRRGISAGLRVNHEHQ